MNARAASVVLFTRDLRINDHPGLAAAAARRGPVVPLFVVDPAIERAGFRPPNREAFLAESLADVRGSLRELGGDLVVRHGDPADVTADLVRRLSADRVYVADDVSAFARRRLERLRAAVAPAAEVETTPGVTVVPTDRLTSTSGGPYRVFTPFWRAWTRVPWRPIAPTPARIRLPDDIDPGELPLVDRTRCSPRLAAGGETAGRAALRAWARAQLADYDQNHDDLAGDRTSRISPYLHFGCLSPLEVATRLLDRPGGEAFTRQLAWRDFHHQTHASFQRLPTDELRPHGRQWRNDSELITAWQQGTTGVPLVDAGMRQLLDEGWMHNRVRMVTASYLTKTLGIDWRIGAAHFLYWLVDGDLANNSANWQWVAGTGTDTRPNRVLNPYRQAERHDPDGTYVRRHLGDAGSR